MEKKKLEMSLSIRGERQSDSWVVFGRLLKAEITEKGNPEPGGERGVGGRKTRNVGRPN